MRFSKAPQRGVRGHSLRALGLGLHLACADGAGGVGCGVVGQRGINKWQAKDKKCPTAFDIAHLLILTS